MLAAARDSKTCGPHKKSVPLAQQPQQDCPSEAPVLAQVSALSTRRLSVFGACLGDRGNADSEWGPWPCSEAVVTESAFLRGSRSI